MLSILYASSAVYLFKPEELIELLKESQERNAERNITGMLLYRDGNFIQAIEGPDDAVEQLYKKIEQDSRHRNVTLLAREPIKDRQFPDWRMGFCNIDELTKQELEAYTSFLTDQFTPQFFEEKPVRAYIMLLTFKDMMR